MSEYSIETLFVFSKSQVSHERMKGIPLLDNTLSPGGKDDVFAYCQGELTSFGMCQGEKRFLGRADSLKKSKMTTSVVENRSRKKLSYTVSECSSKSDKGNDPTTTWQLLELVTKHFRFPKQS